MLDRIMRPNTSHTVVTTTPSICTGGHFYSTATIRESCFAIIYCFLAGTILTNNDHASDSFLLLGRVMGFYHQKLYTYEQTGEIYKRHFRSAAGGHVPNVLTPQGLLD